MENEGIIQATLWFPKAVGAFLFEGLPLRWSDCKKY
jgi:hypothetical protein